VTAAFDTTAPDGSLTVPESEAEIWACEWDAQARTNKLPRTGRRFAGRWFRNQDGWIVTLALLCKVYATARQATMIIGNSLQEIRKKRGISAADLARRVGISRQTIYAIENGNFVPNTTVALQLARALDVKIDDIFSISDEYAPEPMQADLLPVGQVNEGHPVRLCRVNERLIAIPTPMFPAYLPAADAMIESRKKLTVRIGPTVESPERGTRLLLAGCDPALSLLQHALQASGIELIGVPAASRLALEWLKQGRVHAAGSHLLDRASGKYNLPIIRRLLPKTSLRVVTFAIWEQGLVVRRGNPKGIGSIADLAGNRLKIANREKGAGSRELLDSNLRKLGIPFKQVNGYDSIAQGHLAAAYAVAAGGADCCIAPRSAARCFGLDFVPLAVERFDLSFTRASLDSPAPKALLDVLQSSHFRRRLESIAGYDTAHTGEVLI
jgi:molybdate-binding protein/DNA-binding XRE family transcriptional regulator